MKKGEVLFRRSMWAYLFAMLLFLFSPILVTIAFSFNDNRFGVLPWRGFTLRWYEQIIEFPVLLGPLQNSILVGIAVSLTAVVLGFLGAYGIRHYSFRWNNLFLLGMMSPLAVPWMLLGLGLVIFFASIGLRQSLITVWISHLVFGAPLALVIINARLNTISKSLEEAAADLGASQLQTIVKILIPQALPGIIAAMLLTFTLSFDEFIIAWFVSGFSETLPVSIYSMMRSGTNPTINSIGSIVFSMSITLTVLAQFLIRSRGREEVKR